MGRIDTATRESLHETLEWLKGQTGATGPTHIAVYDGDDSPGTGAGPRRQNMKVGSVTGARFRTIGWPCGLDASNRRQNPRRVDWFLKPGVRPELFGDRRHVVTPRNHDDGHGLDGAVGALRRSKRKAIHSRHIDVQQDELRTMAPGQRQPFAALASGQDSKLGQCEEGS